MTAELGTWAYEGGDDGEILDADVIEEVVEPLPMLPVLYEPAVVAVPGVPAWAWFTSPEATAALRRGTWATGHFLVSDLPCAICVGLGRWVRGWWRWMYLSTEREAARENGTWDTRAKGVRDETKLRVKQSAAVLVLLVVSGLVFYWLAPPEYVAALAAALLLGLFSTGYAWSRPRETQIGRAANMGWAGDVETIRQALISAKLMSDDEAINCVVPPMPVGAGYRTTVDLPRGLTVDKVKTKRGEFASALAVDSAFMSIEKGSHDGRMRLWVAVDDPFRSGPKRSPLLDLERWNAWQPAPYGDTPSGLEVPLRLIYSNYLGGGKPRSGKTFSARTAVAPYILDPRPRIFCANGKGDAAWNAIGQVAVEYVNGRGNDAAWRVNAMLDRIIAEMDDRFSKMSGSRITEADGLEQWVVIVDEVHLYTANSELTDERVRGKKDAPLGQVIAYKLTDIVKIGPAAGIILVLLTQKPGDTSIPADLRDQMGTRAASKVMNYQTSNQILGNLSPLGYDASRISSQHKGVVILVPDMDEDVLGGLDLDDYPTVRVHLIDDDDFEMLCGRGRELRLEAGTLEHGDGETDAPATDGITDADIVASEIPEVLESIFDFVHGREDRERVASRELWQRFNPDVTETAFVRQLVKWTGRRTDREGNGPKGPRVREIRAAVERMRGGGPIEVEPQP